MILNILISGFTESGICHQFNEPKISVLLYADLIMQIFRDIAGCGINCTSHIEGWHRALKVQSDQAMSPNVQFDATAQIDVLNCILLNPAQDCLVLCRQAS